MWLSVLTLSVHRWCMFVRSSCQDFSNLFCPHKVQLLILYIFISGMLVQDPTGGKHDVDAIFDQARQMGALQGPFESHLSSSSRNFTGTGRLLSGETVPTAAQPPENVVHNIYFWSNGFTVDDGPLRRFDDSENASFLEVVLQAPDTLFVLTSSSVLIILLFIKGFNTF